ncbi:hypothetical protein A5746_08905 [Mycolicibacterium conceptionense]|nr:hypothetical protein A5639_25700 [Mycolicibacterium conceptionense]OMB78033.1 hypothetical protein A5746_08905 [Mycolicibacterium conceptionense]OMB89523.1 hypothetical protein A5741_13310 [Mycolicibacterium conceptionense]
MLGRGGLGVRLGLIIALSGLRAQIGGPDYPVRRLTMNTNMFLNSLPRTPADLILGSCPFLGGFVAFAGGSVASCT